MELPKRLQVTFYRTQRGAEPVREWLRDLTAADRRAIGEALKEIEVDWPVGMPLCRPLGKGLYETRVTLPDRIARVFFVPAEGKAVVLHAFIKKSMATPKIELDLARRRQKDWEADQ